MSLRAKTARKRATRSSTRRRFSARKSARWRSPKSAASCAIGGRADRHAIGGLGDLGEQAAAGDQRADPVAGQAVDLGEAVEVDQRLLPVGEREQAVRRGVARQEVAVGLVEHHSEAVRPREFVEGVDRLRRVDGAGRVVGRHQDDRPGAGGDPCAGIGRLGHAAALGPEGQVDGRDALHLQPHLVVEVGGRGQDRLVARSRQRHQREAEGLVAAGGDRHLLVRHPAAIGLGERRRERAAQVVAAEDRGIARRLRPAHSLREMRGEGIGRRVGRHRLGQIEQGLVGREAAACGQTRDLGDRRRVDGADRRVDAIGEAVAVIGPVLRVAAWARAFAANRRIPRRAARCCASSGLRRPPACRRRRSARSRRSGADR